MGSFRLLILGLALAAGLQAGPPPPPPMGPHPPGPPPRLSPELRKDLIARTEAEIRDLRWRLQRLGQAEAERGEDRWWDLPSRRRRQFRLRQLRVLRERLEDAQARLFQLQAPPPPRPERPLEDKRISGTTQI